MYRVIYLWISKSLAPKFTYLLILSLHGLCFERHKNRHREGIISPSAQEGGCPAKSPLGTLAQDDETTTQHARSDLERCSHMGKAPPASSMGSEQGGGTGIEKAQGTLSTLESARRGQS